MANLSVDDVISLGKKKGIDMSKYEGKLRQKFGQSGVSDESFGQSTPIAPPQTNDGQVAQILKSLRLTPGQGVVNAMSVVGGGKPVYDPNMENEAVKNGAAIKYAMAPFQQEKLKAETANQNTQAGLPPNPNGQPQGEEGQTQLPQNFEAIAKQIASYEGNASVLLSRVPIAVKGMIQKRVQEINPSWNEQNYQTIQKTKDQYASGDIGSNIRGFNTAIQHLGDLDQAVGKVPDSGVAPLEGVKRWVAKTFQGKGPAALGMTEEATALNAVTGELSNIFKKTGGTDTEIGHFLSSYDPNSSREAKRVYITEGIKLMKDRLGSLGNDWTRVMGAAGIPDSKYPGELISPESQSTIDRLTGGQQGQNQTQGGSPEGTVISNGQQKLVKKGGQWVPMQ